MTTAKESFVEIPWLQPLEEDSQEDFFFEMATIRKIDSGLPANIWVDDSASYKKGGHGKRIKFQPNKSDRPNTRGVMSTMTISDDPKVIAGHKKIELSSKEIEKIRQFVIVNKKSLEDLSDMKIGIFDFGKKMIKV
jgi:hypothetical protein